MRTRTVLVTVLGLLALGLVGAAPAHADDPGPIDAIFCPELVALSPGVPGFVDITAEGDTTVMGEPLWDCPPYGNLFGEPPRASGHVTIHRFPEQEPRLLAAPSTPDGNAWSCVDINTGAPVTAGSTLRSPNPGVYCTPPPLFSTRCTSVQAGGYYTAGAGAVIVTSACDGLQAQQSLTLGSNASSGPVSGQGRTPWSCQVTEFLVTPSLTDYWTFCDVNVP